MTSPLEANAKTFHYVARLQRLSLLFGFLLLLALWLLFSSNLNFNFGVDGFYILLIA
jgi:hypothetical protein